MTMRAGVRAALVMGAAALLGCGSSQTPAGSTDGGADQLGGLDAGDGGPNLGDGLANPDLAPPVDPNCPSGNWCSALFPSGWKPTDPADPMGRYLPDYSYAGYHFGETPPSPTGPVFDVVATYGADATAATDSRAAIQAAIDAAGSAGGGVVWIPAGTYRVDGLLTVTHSNTVLRGAGPSQSRIYFTQATGMTDKNSLSLRGTVTFGPHVALGEDGEERAQTVKVADASGLAVGDEIAIGWVITDDFIAEHHMTGTWVAFNGQWKPIFRRTIVAIDALSSPAVITVDVPLRYPAKLRDSASLRKVSGYLTESGVEELGLSNGVAWDDAWSSDRAHVVSLSGVKDGWVRHVESFQSPLATAWSSSDTRPYHLQSGGLVVLESRRVSVLATTLQSAQHRGSGGNGYLFEVSKSNEVLIADSVARAGRHNFIQNWDFGTTGCVFLRCSSAESHYVSILVGVPIETAAACEYHHSLAMANLIDDSVLDDGWIGYNRLTESTGAGHTSTQGTFWNVSGSGTIRSKQYGWGYIIGPGPGITVDTDVIGIWAADTAPQDFVEGVGASLPLWPESLYEEQRLRRLAGP